MSDANKALERRPKDKLYLAHKEELTRVIQTNIGNQVKFVSELVDRALYSMQLKQRVRDRKKKLLSSDVKTI